MHIIHAHKTPLAARTQEPLWVRRLRVAARVATVTLPDPTFRYGLNIGLPAPTLPAPDEEAGTVLPTVSGSGACVVLPLVEAASHPAYADAVAEAVAKRPAPQDRLAAWHTAQALNGLCIVVPAGVRIPDPLHLAWEVPAGCSFSNMVIIAEEGSAVTVTARATSASAVSDSVFRSAAVDVVVRPGASVTYIDVQDLASGALDFTRRTAQVAAAGKMTWVDATFGSAFAFGRTRTTLFGDEARGTQRTLFFGTDAQKVDLAAEMRHHASHTHAELVSRGALAHDAQAVVRGLLHVAQGTAGCTGFQKEDTLLMSPTATVHTVPMLEIHSADVTCGHSATTSTVDDEQRFYLTSRGVDPETATQLLVAGFFAPVLTDIHAAGLAGAVHALLACRLDALPSTTYTVPAYVSR